MFDIGFSELCLIVVAAVFLIGPKDIPAALETLGRSLRRLQYMKYSITAQFERFMAENNLNEVRHFSVDPHEHKSHKLKDTVTELEANELLPPTGEKSTDHTKLS
jgi:sec-independent protein translocase protein TatB